MSRRLKSTSIVTSIVIVALGLSMPSAWAGMPLKVSDFGDLQSAIDAAQVDDTIIVDVDTPGAHVNKRLSIRGVPGQETGGLITSAPLGAFGLPAGLLLSSGASGSELINLKIHAPNGIVSDIAFWGVQQANDVLVRGCDIRAADFGMFLTNFGFAGSGWTIEHNTMELLPGDAVFLRVFAGIAMVDQWHDTRVAHNKIFGTETTGLVNPIQSGGVIVIQGGSNIEIVQNEIAVNVDPAPERPLVEAVMLTAFGDAISNVTVSMNDFSGSQTTFGSYAVTYVGTMDANSDLTGLGAFDIFVVPSAPGTFAIGGNLSEGSGNRGELAFSDVPIEDLLAVP